MPIPAGPPDELDIDLPDWTPPREDVADYVPGRTLANATVGVSTFARPRKTFDDTTDPDGDQVDRLIVGAVNWVTVKTGPTIAASLAQNARDTAAVYTAALIERGYPRNAGDLDTANALYAQAVDMRADLVKANEALTGQDPVDPAASVMPVWYFPPPETSLDDTTFF